MDAQTILKGIPALRKADKKMLVPLAAAATVATVAGCKGVIDTLKGRRIRSEASQRIEVAFAACEVARVEAQQLAVEYGEYQIYVYENVNGLFADWLERNEHLVKRKSFMRATGMDVQLPDIPQYVAGFKQIITSVLGMASGVGAGIAAQASALWGVSALASASTGTAIASLSGAAARNATLAWFGGGAVAAGGGGVAAGGAMLGLISLVPVLLVGGMTMGVVGARTRTNAAAFTATAEIELERIALAEEQLRAVGQRIRELHSVLGQLSQRAENAVSALDALNFNPEYHACEFLKAYQLVTAISEVLNAPVLDAKSGELSEASVKILRKYT